MTKFCIKPLFSLDSGTGRGIREPMLTCSSSLLINGLIIYQQFFEIPH